jgi:hypothetical protein
MGRNMRYAAAVVVVGAAVLTSLPARSSEVSIAQVRGTIRTAMSQLDLASIPKPFAPMQTAQQINNPPDIGPGVGNYAYTYQQGNHNLAAVSQGGRGNFSQLYQVGNNNTAIVTQTHR